MVPPRRAALALALSLAAITPLAAQSDSTTARKPDLAMAERPNLGGDAYVAAYRRSARLACRAGAINALTATLRDTRTTLDDLPDDAQRRIGLSLDSAFLDVERSGGCPALLRPTRLVVVDSFDGLSWNAPLRGVGSPGDGRYDENGFLLLSRSVKLHGIHATAVYYFTAVPGEEELVKGEYLVPARTSQCIERWRRIEQDLVARYPTLRVLRVRQLPATADSSSWRGRCEALLHSPDARWSTTFRNRDTDALELAMVMRPAADGELVIRISYPGYTMR